jgi:type IV secretory pathway TrbL component
VSGPSDRMIAVAETFLEYVVIVGVVLHGLLLIAAAVAGDVREMIATGASVGELLCVYGLYRALIVCLVRWRDRKFAEIERRYHGSEGHR